MNQIGIVVIGKNEGKRLERCLETLIPLGKPIIYVDSKSHDQSVPFAKNLGLEVIVLDHNWPTAALSRNIGFERLMQIAPETTLVQFVDGDCELDPDWLKSAEKVFDTEPQVAIVAGILNEKDAHQNIYKRLSQIEWYRAMGEIDYTGGNFMMRAAVFQQIGGFNPLIYAAEDNDLGFRTRQHGWKIVQINYRMAIHDSRITDFKTFWERSMRTGYAFAQVYLTKRESAQPLLKREFYSTLFWGGLIPLVAVAGVVWSWWSLALLLAYPLLFLKIYVSMKEQWGSENAFWYAYGCIVGKFPALLGILKYWWHFR